MSNNLLHFSVYESIYKLFGNNNLIWKLQFRYVGLLVEVSVSLSIVCYCCFYHCGSFYKHRFSLRRDFLVFFVNQGGSLSSAVNVQCGIKIEIIFQIVFVQNEHLLVSTGLYESSVPIKHINCSSDKISICILVVLDVTKIRCLKKISKVKFCENDLVMSIRI